ncbi:MAG: hypothetical protein EBV34_16500 [Betaproteobacteria bacterium]|nr:hypothetical protein [Betaproteobacteria bacterium]
MAALTLACLIVVGSQQSFAQPTPEPIRFIDLSKFDTDLERALKGSNESITVMFYEKTSPNNMPNRLQKWVTAVEKSGGKIDVEPPPDEPRPRSPAMLIGLLGGLWSSIKAWGEIRERAMLDAVQTRNVLIHLERNAAGEIIVGRVAFPSRP